MRHWECGICHERFTGGGYDFHMAIHQREREANEPAHLRARIKELEAENERLRKKCADLDEAVTAWEPALTRAGDEIAQIVDELWPDGDDPASSIFRRVAALSEECGEVARAVLKRNHARHGDGSYRGMTEAEWTDNLRVELAQLIGIAVDIAVREGFNPDMDLDEVVEALRVKALAAAESSAPDNEGSK